MTAHRILLYGASNLWLSRRAVLTELRKRFPGYLEIGLAPGPGRSYGLRAGNPLIRYEALQNVDFGFSGEVRGEMVAFLTDIGNDIAYSQPPPQIVDWVRRLSDRLQSQGYRVIVGGIPSRSLARLHPRLFKTVARLYYPEGSVSQQLVTRNLEEVELGIRDLCLERELPYLELDPNWYTFDRFHLKSRACTPYWQSLLQSFPEKHAFSSNWSWAARRPLFPKRYWLVGRERTGHERYRDLVPHSTTRVR